MLGNMVENRKIKTIRKKKVKYKKKLTIFAKKKKVLQKSFLRASEKLEGGPEN